MVIYDLFQPCWSLTSRHFSNPHETMSFMEGGINFIPLCGPNGWVGKLQLSKSGPLIVFVNKVLLEHSHAHLCMYCLRLLSREVATEILWPTKHKAFLLRLFIEKAY